MKVAVVHDWLVTYAGAERVLEAILELYPESDIYSVVDFLKDDQRFFIKNKKVKTTYIQKFPFAASKYRAYLPFMPLAIEQFDLSEYDLIISSSYAVAKGVITGPDQVHICYCHSPIRYAWDMKDQYLREAGLEKGIKSLVARIIMHRVRLWDLACANRVDYYISNSDFIGRRIRKVYRRSSKTVYPNVDVDSFEVVKDKEDYYFTASRMVPYKRMDLIVKAFSEMPEKRLIVIGSGPQFENIKSIAPPNVTLLGYQTSDVLKSYMQRARAFIFAAEEDFGIIPVEAQACGTPVIAFGKGGVCETVIDKKTGILFYEQTPSAICEAITRFENSPLLDPDEIRKNAERFSKATFLVNMRNFVERVMTLSINKKNNDEF